MEFVTQVFFFIYRSCKTCFCFFFRILPRFLVISSGCQCGTQKRGIKVRFARFCLILIPCFFSQAFRNLPLIRSLNEPTKMNTVTERHIVACCSNQVEFWTKKSVSPFNSGFSVEKTVYRKLTAFSLICRSFGLKPRRRASDVQGSFYRKQVITS